MPAEKLMMLSKLRHFSVDGEREGALRVIRGSLDDSLSYPCWLTVFLFVFEDGGYDDAERCCSVAIHLVGSRDGRRMNERNQGPSLSPSLPHSLSSRLSRLPKEQILRRIAKALSAAQTAAAAPPGENWISEKTMSGRRDGLTHPLLLSSDFPCPPACLPLCLWPARPPKVAARPPAYLTSHRWNFWHLCRAFCSSDPDIQELGFPTRIFSCEWENKSDILLLEIRIMPLRRIADPGIRIPNIGFDPELIGRECLMPFFWLPLPPPLFKRTQTRMVEWAGAGGRRTDAMRIAN